MRTKTLSTALAALVCIVLALPVSAADGSKPLDNVLQAIASTITAWFVGIEADPDAVVEELPEDSAATPTAAASDGDRAELGPIIFPGG